MLQQVQAAAFEAAEPPVERRSSYQILCLAAFKLLNPSFNGYIGQSEAVFVFTCFVLTMSDLNTYADSYISEDEQAANDWWSSQWEGYELTYQGNCVFIDGEPLFW